METTRQGIIMLLLCLMIVSCKAQKDSLLYDTTPIDMDRFFKHRDHINDYSYYTKDSTYVHVDGYVRLLDTTRIPVKFTKRVTPKGSTYQYQYQYRKDGSLHRTFKIYPNDFNVYAIEYDTKGNIIEENDYDKDYPYPFEKVQQFIKDREIYTKHLRVIRGALDGVPGWEISWRKKENIFIMARIILDGRTGEILEMKENGIGE